ncbi:hypothetical protein HPP92_028985 [Vanilla planifolia]|uniref:Uncharacterized protein n=1 Tax=Vanilla planifolia TaxID=51239 RepID=A0A835P5B6_VANPL|nr:hypothetical protein HPP92_028985 [Vanilla planifolia]KAG0446146.1 hypothetical protein HPP92_028974 [Vanilla planifolia]
MRSEFGTGAGEDDGDGSNGAGKYKGEALERYGFVEEKMVELAENEGNEPNSGEEGRNQEYSDCRRHEDDGDETAIEGRPMKTINRHR